MNKAHQASPSRLLGTSEIKKCKKRGGWVKAKHSANKITEPIIHLILLKISEDLVKNCLLIKKPVRELKLTANSINIIQTPT